MKQIQTSIDIDAPPEQVWDVLVDVDRWHEWNPFADALTGELRVGNKVAVHMRNGPGGRAMTIRPEITVVEPDRELRWVGGLLHPKVMRGEHHFLLEPHGVGGCHLEHGETFTGALVALLGPVLVRGAAGYQDLNDALKARVEAREGQ